MESHHDLRHQAKGGEGQPSGEQTADPHETHIPAEGGHEHIHRVIAGHKANLSNPNTSQESKRHSERVLQELNQYDQELHQGKTASSSSPAKDPTPQPPPPPVEHHTEHHAHLHHKGGQPHPEDVVQPGQSVVADDPGHGEPVIVEEKRVKNVISGYKAALKNPRVGAEAKEKAEEVLEELGAK